MSSLRFRRLVVRRMLGIQDGFEIRDLAPGVNLVYGPNASGKTTTARALEALIWPRSNGSVPASVEATAELGGDLWSIRIDGDLIEHQRNGAPTAALPAPPAEGRDRYRLWLPDLLRSEDGDFAREILIESSGGFDLAKAARVLEARRLSHRQRAQQAELRQAREKVRQARAAQEALARESLDLAGKEARLAIRPTLEARLHLLRIAAEHARRRDEAAALRAELDAYPPILGRLRGDEAEQVDSLREQIADTRRRLDDARAEKLNAERGLRRISLPRQVVSGDALERLDADLDRLTELDRVIEEQERRLREAGERMAGEEAPLGTPIDPVRLAELDLSGLGDLSRSIATSEELRETRRNIAAELAALPDARVAEGSERLQQGLVLLRQWLSSEEAGSTESSYLLRLAMVGSAALLVAAVVLLATGQAVWGILTLAAAGVLYALIQRRPQRLDLRPQLEREYVRLGLVHAPDLWNPQSVQRCLSQLEERAAQVRIFEQSAVRRRQLIARLEEVDRRLQQVVAELGELAAEFGLTLPDDGVRLFWVVERVSRWQRARVEKIGAEAALVQAWGAQKAVLETVNERLEPLGIEPIKDPRALRGTVERLRKDLATHETLTRARSEAQGKLEREEAALARLEADLERIHQRAEITSADEYRLAELCPLVEEYQQKLRAFEVADAQRRNLESQLQALPDLDPAVLSETPVALGSRIAEVERELADLNVLAQEVGSLRERIASARSAHALEDALAEEARMREAVLELRARELRAAVGAALVEFVEREARNEHLPEVFHRANRLFNWITRGAYELRVDSEERPSFLAYDTRLERGFPLEQLSSGTRVQLLLAVRIAFIERLEGGTALPLLMDETLANSDDERAAAIIDSVVQLASDGRQVFYFTAQPDEIAKWTRALATRADVSFTSIDLGELRNLEKRLDFAQIGGGAPRKAPPAPVGLSHREYGVRLRVPAIDLHAPAASVHLWYLVEDIKVLHQAVAVLHVGTWGELRSIMSTGGYPVLEPEQFARVQAAADAAEATLDYLRIGRPRRPDRGALLASGGVSERFIEQVDELRRLVGSDAEALLRELENRAVPNFLRRNIDALREFFEREGFLDPREPMDIEAVRKAVFTEHAAAVSGGRITLQELDRVVTRIAAGAGCLPPAAEEPDPLQPQLWPEIPA